MEDIGKDISSAGFSVTNNVYITVVNNKKKRIVKKVEKHNKATRRMITGLLKFIEGQFNHTQDSTNTIMDDDNYRLEKPSDYIPVYIGVGHGFVDEEQPSIEEDPLIPNIVGDPASYVQYESTHLEKEYPVKRSKIRKVSSSIDVSEVSGTSAPLASMDSIYFECRIPENTINDGLNPVFVTEVGLFSGDEFSTEDNPKDDLLAYVKLLNYNKKVSDLETDTRDKEVLNSTIQKRTKSCYIYDSDDKNVEFIVEDQLIRFTANNISYKVIDGFILREDGSGVAGTFNYEKGYICFYDVLSQENDIDVDFSSMGNILKVHETELATNALYVKPDDTIIIRWIISIVSIGVDNMVTYNKVDSKGRPLDTTIVVPDLPVVSINVLDPGIYDDEEENT